MPMADALILFLHFFFFQAEDGIRDRDVTGVQTCALPISTWKGPASRYRMECPTGSPPPTKCPATINDMARLAPTATMPISAPLKGIRLPNSTMRKNATAGSDGMIHAKWITPKLP